MKQREVIDLPSGKRVPIIDAIAEALYSIKAHQLPNYCNQPGLDSGTKEARQASAFTTIEDFFQALMSRYSQ